MAMIFALPEAIFSNVYTFQDPNRNVTFESCNSYPISERLLQEIHSLLCFLVFYIIPLSIISVYYSLIARTLYKSTLNIPTEEQSHARKQVCINWYSCKYSLNLRVSPLQPLFSELHGIYLCRHQIAVYCCWYEDGLLLQSEIYHTREQCLASYLTSLSPNFFICKMKKRTEWHR